MNKILSVREFQRRGLKVFENHTNGFLILVSKSKPIAKITPLTKKEIKDFDLDSFAGVYSGVDRSYLSEKNDWDF